nr:MAG TPA: Cytochrome C oxidase assembly factor 2 [Caudoviricetes sp.]
MIDCFVSAIFSICFSVSICLASLSSLIPAPTPCFQC